VSFNNALVPSSESAHTFSHLIFSVSAFFESWYSWQNLHPTEGNTEDTEESYQMLEVVIGLAWAWRVGRDRARARATTPTVSKMLRARETGKLDVTRVFH